MRRTIDKCRPSWPPRPPGHPVDALIRITSRNRDLPGRDDHVIDPFTGTGSFAATAQQLGITNENTDERSR